MHLHTCALVCIHTCTVYCVYTCTLYTLYIQYMYNTCVIYMYSMLLLSHRPVEGVWRVWELLCHEGSLGSYNGDTVLHRWEVRVWMSLSHHLMLTLFVFPPPPPPPPPISALSTVFPLTRLVQCGMWRWGWGWKNCEATPHLWIAVLLPGEVLRCWPQDQMMAQSRWWQCYSAPVSCTVHVIVHVCTCWYIIIYMYM